MSGESRVKIVKMMLILISCAFAVTTLLYAAQQKNSYRAKPSPWNESMRLYKKGEAAVENQDYIEAFSFFEKAYRRDKDNPKILNMLAYTQAKLGRLEDAIINYKRAIEFEPDFIEAHAYLGEAYMQSVLRQIEVLREHGGKGSSALEELIELFKDAASAL